MSDECLDYARKHFEDGDDNDDCDKKQMIIIMTLKYQ